MKKVILTALLALSIVPISHAGFVQYAMDIDDYAQLYIDGGLVATYDDYNAGAVYTSVLNLSDGWHDIQINYQNRWGSNRLVLREGDDPITLESLRYMDITGNYISGLRADYYYPNGSFITTVYGEGPIQHGYMGDLSTTTYQGVAGPGNFWAGQFDFWGLFQERLTGQILVGSPVPAPGALLLAGIGTGLVGWLRRRRSL